MNFKSYDILSSLVPGFLILIVILKVLNIPFQSSQVIPYTAIAFLLGYIINTLSSWLEDFYFWTWGGKPSSNLLKGKGIWKVKFYHSQKAKELLIEDSGITPVKDDELFSIAMRVANGEKETRIEDLNSLYAFSRAILTTILISTIILTTDHYYDWRYYVISIPLTIIAWLRCKQRGYYYCKEVLNVYLNKKQS